jgi:ABC-type oligopeptide transport system substrate-binding subunit
MRVRTSFRLLAVTAAVTLLASACGGGDGGGDEPAESGGVLRIYSSEPAHLVPTAGNDQPAILVIRQLYSGLVDYDNETGAPVNDIAESIESADNVTWTVTLKDGYTFHNGEPVDTDSFIRAWNYAADGDNGQENAYFMSRIVGFDESQEGGDALSGLVKIDDLTFTVELSAPFVGFPAIVGYSGFFPVAEACLADFEACEETPIGNGPYMIEGTWDHNVGITLVRNEDYAGTLGKPDTLEYKIYSEVDAAYAAFQAGELDVMYTVPPERSAEVIQNNPDRIYDEPGHSFTYIGLPQYLEEFEDPRIAQALSMAIDRQAIIDAVFDGRQVPAEGVVSPQFDGFRPGACEFCAYDPEAAQALLEEAGGWQWGTLELWANAGAGHENWLQAVGDQLNTNLGIDYTLEISLEFPEYLEKAQNSDFTGGYRLGWGPDYPVIETYLAPLYQTGNSSNYSGYSNQEFDQLIAEGDAAPSLEEAIPAYQAAEDIIVQDLPVIPMWFAAELAVWSTNVEEFVWNPINEPEYDEMTVAQG